MRAICDEFEGYGWRRVGAAFATGDRRQHKRMRGLMREHDLQPRRRRRFVATTDSDHDRPIFPDRAKGMVVDAPNQLWVADITYIAIGPASPMWPPSSMPGRAEWSVMRSAGRSMPD